MTQQVHFNHDGGVDDLVSLFLLLQMDNINLIGVSTIGADCYLEPSLSASMKIINRFSTKILLLHLHMSVVLIRFLKIGECMRFLWMRYLF